MFPRQHVFIYQQGELNKKAGLGGVTFSDHHYKYLLCWMLCYTNSISDIFKLVENMLKNN